METKTKVQTVMLEIAATANEIDVFSEWAVAQWRRDASASVKKGVNYRLRGTLRGMWVAVD